MIKKIFLLLSSIFTLAIISITGVTLAYLTAQTQLENTIKVGLNTTSIQEIFPTPQPIKPDTEQTYQKTVSVTNSDSVPCYIRVLVAFNDDNIGQAVSFLNLNKTDWEYIEDAKKDSLKGYYYYKHPLLPGESTKALFDGIKIEDNLNISDSSDTAFQIIVYEESLQCSPHTTYLDAWNAFLRE